MALPIWQRTITTASGDLVPNAEITVVNEATGLGATIFSNREGTTPLGTGGVFFTGSDGFAQFYAAPGEYRVTAEGVSGSQTWRWIALVGDAAFMTNETDDDTLRTAASYDAATPATAATIPLRGAAESADEGTFRVADATEDQHPVTLKQFNSGTTPFSPNHLSYLNAAIWHTGLTYRIVAKGEKWISVYRRGRSHEADELATVECAISDDAGITWREPIVVYNETDMDTNDFCMAEMAGGRIGIIAGRRDDVGVEDSIFLWSDDDGLTWSSQILTGVTAGFLAHFSLIPYPTSAGGDDDGGYIAFGFISGVRTSIEYIYTTNNGTTWTQGTAFSDVTFNNVTEPSVARIGDSDQWVMAVRDESSNTSNLLIAKSTNLTTWTGPFDSGQQLGRNPPYIDYRDGKLHLYAASRQYLDRNIESFGDVMLHQKEYAATIWDNDGEVWPGWGTWVAASNPLGYMQIFESDGTPYAIFAFDEAHSANDGGIRQYERATSRVALVSHEARQDSKGVNHDFIKTAALTGSLTGGVFRKYADGWMECWKRDFTLTYQSTTALDATWVFPEPFFEVFGGDGGVVEAVSATLTDVLAAAKRGGDLSITDITNDQMRIRLLHADPVFEVGDSVTVSVYAGGRHTDG